jgi:acetolactate synthase regulatory subunit
MSHNTFTVLVILDDDPRALGRLLARCHGRGWTPVSLRSTYDGKHSEVLMRLRVPADRRGTVSQVRAQLGRLVDVRQVVVDSADGVPDGVAFAAVRRMAPWAAVAA